MEFREQMERLARDFDCILEAYFKDFTSEVDQENEKFKEIMAYSLLAEGKRLRPILLLKTYEMFGGTDVDLAQSFAVAIECIHNYSLIHDDLPCMDNDDYRRGRQTNHKVYGEDMALLAGDALLNLAYEIMIEAGVNSSNPNSMLAMLEIASNAGVNGMIGGQVMEILTEAPESKKIGADTALKVKMLKTSCLFSASIMAGAILAGAETKYLSDLEEYSGFLGLAFQLKDDIMDHDYFVDKEGDLAGLSEEEATYKVASSFVNHAKEKLKNIDLDTSFFEEFADYMISRKK